jgi:Ni/Co efflux regulator RcnB
MSRGSKTALFLAGALVLATGSASAEDRGGGRDMRPAPHQAERHAGPTNYQRVTEPQGWNARPATVNRGAYQHNYQAARSFHIGAYQRPEGWADHRWGFGQILPRSYWAPQYILSDYWLFSLEVPPAGYEWVRDEDDALLVNTANGEILQVEYGVFA